LSSKNELQRTLNSILAKKCHDYQQRNAIIINKKMFQKFQNFKCWSLKDTYTIRMHDPLQSVLDT